ncbi:ABATE domain-containing protein [Streptomyces sp. TRM 70361]|uniref:CGNR zinc finger domain-containing protein n=1 Tax=Streptomyces sp. TRM 70361 TaxID=3116553 RepID=UPI002E7BD653|nr:ABATE domain-containing protein [Streptomyces sp. TRM 70361]MEE1938785.1 ABATE domain-containing protein [Streptomyces sp. TRM 70361]
MLRATERARRGTPVELLPTPDALSVWTAAAGMLDSPAPAGAADLARAIRLREAVYRLAHAAATGTPLRPEDCGTVNEAAAAHPPVRVELRPDGTVRRTGTVDAVLSSLARATVTLLGGATPGLLKECAWSDCTRLYLDRSHRGSRRWCDMAGCGNRAKAAGHRARRTAR